MEPRVTIFHKATSVREHVQSQVINIKMEADAKSDPHPDFAGQGVRLANILYDVLPGLTLESLHNELTNLTKESTQWIE